MSRVAVLYNDDATLAHGSEEDRLAVVGVVEAAAAIRAALEERGHAAELVAVPPEPREAVRCVAGLRCDVAFNLVESIGGESRLDQAFAWLLELHGIPYTGAGPRALGLCLEKPVAKAVLAARGLPVPRGAVLERGDEPLDGLRFPVIVKPSREDASHGISAESVARDESAARTRARHVISIYAQSALVEEYVEAREINAALLDSPAGPELLPLSEIDYSGFGPDEPRIVTYAGKWRPESRDWDLTRVVAARDLSSAQRARIEAVARGAFEGLGLAGYGRVDLRLDRAGEPFVIDVNPNPDLSPGAGFHLSAERAGLSYSDLVLRILDSALSHGRRTA